MSAISLKSISGITSITTPAGVDNQLTLHTNNTTERVKIDVSGNVHINNHLAITGVTTASQGLRVPNGSATTNYISVGNNGALRFWGTGHQYADIRAGNLHFRNAALENVLEIQQDKEVYFYGSAFLQNARFDQTVTIADTITHHGDTDTKIRFPAADTITAETAGNERLRITSGGQVNIGSDTSQSTYLLSLREAGNTRAEIMSTNNTSAGIYLRTFNGGSQVSNSTIRTDNSGNLQIYTGTTSDGERLRIGSGGGHRITCDESHFSANLSEMNTDNLALNIIKTRSGQTKGIGIGAIGNTNSSTGIQAYDTSNNSANPLLINPFGGDVLIGTTTSAGKLTVDSGTSNTCATFQSSDAGAGINLVDNSARSSLEQNGASFKISSDTGAQQASSDIRLQLDGGTKVYIESSGLRMEDNDDVFIDIPSDYRCLVFDQGQKMITSNDGQGNFNFIGGKNHLAQHVNSSSGNSGIAQIEINSDGANGNINFAVGPQRSAGSSAVFEKGFQMVYYSNTSAERLNGLRYTTGTSTSPGGLNTGYPVIHRGNAADGTWARTAGDGFKVLGDGGSIAITTNDGHGNCNVCWNHKDGVPDTAGSSWRIRADIDAANSHWLVQNSKSVSSGSAVTLTTRFEIDENGAGYINGQSFTSDQRLKKNIKNITGATDKIKSLTGRTFEWKEELEYGEGTKYGFVAQELETVLPELVSKALVHFDKDGNIIQDNYSNKDEIVDTAKTVNTIGVIPVLVEALKEALSEIDSLKARVSTLEGS